MVKLSPPSSDDLKRVLIYWANDVYAGFFPDWFYKHIGKIFFSDKRPPDYWAERGYDWYAGL